MENKGHPVQCLVYYNLLRLAVSHSVKLDAQNNVCLRENSVTLSQKSIKIFALWKSLIYE